MIISILITTIKNFDYFDWRATDDLNHHDHDGDGDEYHPKYEIGAIETISFINRPVPQIIDEQLNTFKG